MERENSIPKTVDTIVIGAGMAGLYTAWRIKEKYKGTGEKICIFEKSNRTGGRLSSDLIEIESEHNNSVIKEEEGGMRFVFDGMDNLMSLLMCLKLHEEVIPFPMKSSGNNRLYFRGQSFTQKQAKKDNYAIWSELYNLLPAEKNQNPGHIIDTVFNRILDANPSFEKLRKRTPEWWQDFRLQCKWKNIALIEWSLWNLFSDMGYSNECISMLYYISGFNSNYLSTINAGVAYHRLQEFPHDVEYKTLENGFSTLPDALVEQIGDENIHLETQLLSIKKDDEIYILNYQNNSNNAPHSEIRAKKVILALPRQELQKLFIQSNSLNILDKSKYQKLWNNLQKATNQPLLKINLYYDKAWWGDKISGQSSVEFGPNFTDLPLGSVYPFYAISPESIAEYEYEKWLKENGVEATREIRKKLKGINKDKFHKPAALTIYCDYLNINYWKALQETGEKFNSNLQEKYKEKIYPASTLVVKHAKQYFSELFKTHYIPDPILTSSRIWDGYTKFDTPESQQFGYGIHEWELNANDKEVMEELIEPFNNIYICGEAYSDFQGWVEGALRSANLVLDKGYNLNSISKVYKENNKNSASYDINESYKERMYDLISKYIDCNFEPKLTNNESMKKSNQHNEFEDFFCGVKLSYFNELKKSEFSRE